ncbi:hypothetical protein AMTRI_Chr12g240980 [Amborella trichopoda]
MAMCSFSLCYPRANIILLELVLYACRAGKPCYLPAPLEDGGTCLHGKRASFRFDKLRPCQSSFSIQDPF